MTFILCECGRPIDQCPIHGNVLTKRIVERLGNGRFTHHRGEYHVTELCGCLRQAFLERKHAHAVTIKELMKKAHGSAMHRQLFGFYPWSELPVRMTLESEGETITIVGHIDRFYPEEKAIVEGKSTRFVKWQDQQGMLPRKRDELQLQSYCTIWTNYGFPVEKLWLTYVDDETSPRTFEIEPRDLTYWLRTRAITLHKATLTDSPPKAELNPLCRFCPFKASCNGN